MKEYVRAKRIVLSICWGLIIPALVVALMWRLGAFDQTEQLSTVEPILEEAKEEVTDEPVIEEPVTQEPIAEEPVIQEPVTQEPVLEEPIAEEVIIKESEVEDLPLTKEDITPPTENIEPTIDENGNVEQTVIEPTAPTVDTPVNGQISADGTMKYNIVFGWVPTGNAVNPPTIQLDTTLSGELVGY